MSRTMKDARGPGGLAVSVRRAFDQSSETVSFDDPGFVDVGGWLRRFRHRGRDLVAKRRSVEEALSERDLAAESARRLAGLTVGGFGAVEVCVPELVPLPGLGAALVSPYLGRPLSAGSWTSALPIPVITGLLVALLGRGVEASGCVPRNMFRQDGRTVLIDWEDALLVRAGEAPGELTLMKWDIAWSDLLGRDLKLRERIPVSSPGERTELDGFETVLAAWLPSDAARRDVRRRGVEVTLASELPSKRAGSASAAALGHLAEDVLPARLGVFHTVLTAHLREQCGEDAYASLLGQLDTLVAGSRPAAHATDLGALRRAWVLALFSAAERDVSAEAVPLEQLVRRIAELACTSGWDAARKRAAAAEEITDRLAAVILAVLRLEGLDLLLRGSCAQGVLGLGSDIDFELSSAALPYGHRPAEDLLIEALACFRLDAEGSTARPVERDLVSADGGTGRDLHEWFELRRPGSTAHDPGWAAAALTLPSADTVGRPSQYEDQGRELTAKYLWFESRAALARLASACSGAAPMPVTVERQLAVLPQAIGVEDAAELRDLVHASFALRETADPAHPADDRTRREITRLADRLDLFRRRLGLPGPRHL
ncbi:hypothetical protein HUT16_16990 [Kitasatospora sp. NA04385]|uniref:hypothetical protein n=1 Tax=Kitasatospora sp. NA04385 TaxID=2742135 RepID=UPI001591C5D0|nr:hypothetical protein [Kitasatospora sp. NA04385]QKW20535.1 hypothetical protein HUT16_16990 [Kitasatospora sp. NA04385]